MFKLFKCFKGRVVSGKYSDRIYKNSIFWKVNRHKNRESIGNLTSYISFGLSIFHTFLTLN